MSKILLFEVVQFFFLWRATRCKYISINYKPSALTKHIPLVVGLFRKQSKNYYFLVLRPISLLIQIMVLFGQKYFFLFLLFDSYRAWKMPWNVCLDCSIWTKFEKMGLLLGKNVNIEKCASTSFTLFLLTPGFQWGSVQKFWKFAR
jgi:hypothetical protein